MFARSLIRDGISGPGGGGDKGGGGEWGGGGNSIEIAM